MTHFRCNNLAGLIFILLVTKGFSQNTIAEDNGFWFTMNNKYKITENFHAASFVQLRNVDFIKNPQYLFLSPSVAYNINQNVEIGVGYTFVRTYAYGAYHPLIPKDENRWWQKLTLKSKIGKVSLSNRFVFEERFKDKIVVENKKPYLSGTQYVQRLRYRFELTMNIIKLKNGKYIFGKISEELRIRFKTGLSESDFDQNNLYVFAGYKLLDNSKLWLGWGRDYYKINSNTFVINDILRVNFSYDFDFSKK